MEATSGVRAEAWFLLAALGVANAVGHALDLYARFWWFDRILRACAIFADTRSGAGAAATRWPS